MPSRRAFLSLIGTGVAIAAGSAVALSLPILQSRRRFPEVAFGADACAWCGMVVGDRRFASAYRDVSSNAWRVFDDVGCLMTYAATKRVPLDGDEIAWVSDYRSVIFIEAVTAYYVLAQPNLLWTPMSHGTVTFSSRAEALDFARQKQGSVLDFSAALDHYEEIVGGK